jgi:hypothetical protein
VNPRGRGDLLPNLAAAQDDHSAMPGGRWRRSFADEPAARLDGLGDAEPELTISTRSASPPLAELIGQAGARRP